MEQEKLYNIARKRHGQLNRDVVHDMYCKFGSDLPDTRYVVTCIKHAKPAPVQLIHDYANVPSDPFDEVESEDRIRILSTAINNVRRSYELEIDTFLECKVNSSYKAFQEHSGIARSVLEKICNFAKHEILREYHRITAG